MNDTTRTERIIKEYLDHYPGAREADLTDVTTHTHLRMARRLLTLVDVAMTDEGIDDAARDRALRMALYGSTDPESAVERRVAAAQQIEELSRRSPQPVQLGALWGIGQSGA